ncbi:hypothetical protein McanCB56680_005831 [Microsporum canis]|uniref:Uncharacterized protein n=1 Tax=Arthroderma otae (strain ATCC MYA-4605 / CBS 113480) TaxID=554155 RepID=C5FNQ5_ARTOC|nr:uncharacterized protein MCYG_04577 [Microsporum canis CBS 113480]EEQ31758.1 predicted protein [Microsporum canis CBS 113480]
MSGALTKFGDRVVKDPKLLAKLFKGVTPGSRLLPSRDHNSNKLFQCRVDLGEELHDKPGYYNVYLQVNKEAESIGLRDWPRKNPHGNLAVTTINRNVEEKDKTDEGSRVINELVEQGKKNL